MVELGGTELKRLLNWRYSLPISIIVLEAAGVPTLLIVADYRHWWPTLGITSGAFGLFCSFVLTLSGAFIGLLTVAWIYCAGRKEAVKQQGTESLEAEERWLRSWSLTTRVIFKGIEDGLEGMIDACEALSDIKKGRKLGIDAIVDMLTAGVTTINKAVNKFQKKVSAQMDRLEKKKRLTRTEEAFAESVKKADCDLMTALEHEKQILRVFRILQSSWMYNKFVRNIKLVIVFQGMLFLFTLFIFVKFSLVSSVNGTTSELYSDSERFKQLLWIVYILLANIPAVVLTVKTTDTIEG